MHKLRNDKAPTRRGFDSQRFLCGAAKKNRTSDPVITNHVLYRLSYGGALIIVADSPYLGQPMVGTNPIRTWFWAVSGTSSGQYLPVFACFCPEIWPDNLAQKTLNIPVIKLFSCVFSYLKATLKYPCSRITNDALYQLSYSGMGREF